MRNTPNMPAHKDAPGIRARRRRGGSVAFYWIASDASKSPLVKEYPVRTVRLHFDTDEERSARCWRLTAELKEWLTSRGVGKQAFNGTLTSLIDCYQRDEDSPYRAVKWNTSRHYDEILALIAAAYGARRVDALTGKDFARWYRVFKEPATPDGSERLRRAYNCMKLLRIVCNYGAASGYHRCAEVALMLSKMRFSPPAPRKVAMAYDQAKAIIETAIAQGRPSIALAQALQFELSLRQRDVIGEWIDDETPRVQGIVARGMRWTGGTAWSDIGPDLVLSKTTSKTGTLGQWDLSRYPLVFVRPPGVRAPGRACGAVDRVGIDRPPLFAAQFLVPLARHRRRRRGSSRRLEHGFAGRRDYRGRGRWRDGRGSAAARDTFGPEDHHALCPVGARFDPPCSEP